MKLTKQFLRGLIKESMQQISEEMSDEEFERIRAQMKANQDAVTPEEMINAGIRSVMHDREGNHSGDWGLSQHVLNQIKSAGGDSRLIKAVAWDMITTGHYTKSVEEVKKAVETIINKLGKK